MRRLGMLVWLSGGMRFLAEGARREWFGPVGETGNAAASQSSDGKARWVEHALLQLIVRYGEWPAATHSGRYTPVREGGVAARQ